MAKSKTVKPKKPIAPPELRDERLSFRCPAVLRQAIEAHARLDRRSVSDWIVLALDRVVNQRDHEQLEREGR